MNIPGYWRNETTGVLQPVVQRYLNGARLTGEEIATMRAYLRQWIAAEGFTGPLAETLRRTVGEITTQAQLEAWLDEAIDAGIDPL